MVKEELKLHNESGSYHVLALSINLSPRNYVSQHEPNNRGKHASDSTFALYNFYFCYFLRLLHIEINNNK